MPSLKNKVIDVSECESLREEIHIGGPLHARVYYAGDRGPSILLYLGVFNWTNTAIEQDVFGQIILDMDATKRLLIEMRKIRAEFPDVSNYISCDYKHNGQRSAMACNLCNPWGLRFL